MIVKKKLQQELKKIPPAIFNFIDEQLWQSLPSVDWKWLKAKKMIVKKETTASIKKSPCCFQFYRWATVTKFAICKLKVVEGKENHCQKETTASKKKSTCCF